MTTLIILTITFIVALGIWSYFNTQRELQALSELVCPSCDTRYGIAQAKLAREEHLASCRDIQKKNPHLKISFVRFWKVRCLQCNMVSQFYYETKNLVKQDD